MDFQSLVGPDRTHDDQTFAVRVTRVGLHRVADGALSTRPGLTLDLAKVRWAQIADATLELGAGVGDGSDGSRLTWCERTAPGSAATAAQGSRSAAPRSLVLDQLSCV